MAFPSLSDNYNDLFFLIISLSIATIIFHLFRSRSSGDRQKSKLPPSPPRLPLIGNLHQLGKVPHHSLRALAEKYGPAMYLKLGQIPTLVVSSPDIIREIVSSHDVVFSSRGKSLASDELFFAGENIGFAPYGEYWKRARKICTVNFLSLKMVKSFQRVREQEVGFIVDRVRKACHNDDNDIDLSQVLIEASSNIVYKCILGESYDDQKEEDNKVSVAELSKKMSAQLLSFSVGDFFGWLRWVDRVSGLVARLRATSKELQAFLDPIIQQHKAFSRSESSSEAQDFVDVLLQIQRDSNSGFDLTQTQLKAIVQDMFTGGTDTTSASIEWIMAELLKNPRAMKKAQEEVRKIGAEKSKIDMDDIDRMHYLKNVVKETLRLHPPFPLLVPRETTSIAKLREYEIPAKTRVLVNAWAIQRDPSLWDDPEDFIPERFEKNPMDYFSGHDFRFIPFGFGRRICPGLAFGALTVEYVIANLLYWFDWKCPEEMDMSEAYGLSVHKKFPIRAVPQVFPLKL